MERKRTNYGGIKKNNKKKLNLKKIKELRMMDKKESYCNNVLFLNVLIRIFFLWKSMKKYEINKNYINQK